MEEKSYVYKCPYLVVSLEMVDRAERVRGVQSEVSLPPAVFPGAGEVTPVIVLHVAAAMALLVLVFTTFRRLISVSLPNIG